MIPGTFLYIQIYRADVDSVFLLRRFAPERRKPSRILSENIAIFKALTGKALKYDFSSGVSAQKRFDMTGRVTGWN
jgi:hypothetical protein